MSSTLNLQDAVKEVSKRINSQEECLGKGLMQPFNSANSGSRKIMFGVHREHTLPLLNPEVPIVQTGYENQFGCNSSSFIKADANYVLIEKIPKFSKLPGYHYYAILLDMDNNRLHVMERVSYKHITETYGYPYNNSYMDMLTPGDSVIKGDVIKKSTSFDEYNNRMDGVNLITAYISTDTTMEDGIVLSESAARKFDSPLYKKVPIIVNDNDILLNLYGDNDKYKTFPDIGENVKNGILCAIRREKKEESLFTQSYNRLKDIMMSDDKITVDGSVIDINIYCNNPENLKTSYYNNQLKYYYDENIRFCNQFINAIEPLIKNNGVSMTYDLQKLYYTCKSIAGGKQYIKDRPFSNIIMEVVVMEVKRIEEGDKLSDRYGGKGVVAKIISDDRMPRLENGDIVELINNQSTCVNRENAGQLIETSITHAGGRLLDLLATSVWGQDEMVNMIYKFVSLLNKEQADFMFEQISNLPEEDQANYVESIIMDGGIYVSMRPVSDCLDIDRLSALYKEFPWITQCKISVPIVDSIGNTRYVEARRPIVCGKKYIYRLKQYAEEKFSATSLSATNIRNENSRSKANRVYKGLFTKTPIRFGEMETGDMAHLGMEAVIINLMLHSTSPHGRRLAEELLTGDPFNVDIRLDETSKNRSVEILNVYLKTMGLRLVFEKVYKNIVKPVLKKAVIHYGQSLIKPVRYIEPGEKFDPVANLMKLREIDMPNGLIRPIFKWPIKKY